MSCAELYFPVTTRDNSFNGTDEVFIGVGEYEFNSEKRSFVCYLPLSTVPLCFTAGSGGEEKAFSEDGGSQGQPETAAGLPHSP